MQQMEYKVGIYYDPESAQSLWIWVQWIAHKMRWTFNTSEFERIALVLLPKARHDNLLYTKENGTSLYAHSFAVFDNRSEKYQIYGLIVGYCIPIAWYIRSRRMEKMSSTFLALSK